MLFRCIILYSACTIGGILLLFSQSSLQKVKAKATAQYLSSSKFMEGQMQWLEFARGYRGLKRNQNDYEEMNGLKTYQYRRESLKVSFSLCPICI